MKQVPVFEAKNRFSELIAAVEHGEKVTITRRGVPVASLVAEMAKADDVTDRRQRINAALERLRQIREKLLIEGDLKSLARTGLD